MSSTYISTVAARDLSDTELAGCIANGDHAAFERLMRRSNRRLFRVARAVLKDDAEAEEALQDAYIRAFTQISSFRGDAQLSTWLTRIVVNEALGRLRKQRRYRVIVPFPGEDTGIGNEIESEPMVKQRMESPEAATLRAQVRTLLERKLDELPISFRTVFMMREVEEMTVAETAECLGIPEATVRTRLFRAKSLLRESLAREVDLASGDVFAFAGARCDRIVAAVLRRIRDARDGHGS